VIVTRNKIIGADRPKEVRRLLIPRRSHPGQSWAERDEAPSMAFRFACELLNLDPARLLFFLRAMIRDCRQDQSSSFRVAPSAMMFGCAPRSTNHSYGDVRSCETSRSALSWFLEQTATGTMSASSLMSLVTSPACSLVDFTSNMSSKSPTIQARSQFGACSISHRNRSIWK
jgi:hypothetical protein